MLVDDHNRECLLQMHGELFEFKGKDTSKAEDLHYLIVPKTLWLKLDCPVILLRNLGDTLHNGLCDYLRNSSDTVLTVEFRSLIITTKLTTLFNPNLNKDIAIREQFALKPAFALTINKAQGLTRVEVDCREIFKPGQLGVAFSRPSTSWGLRIINVHPRYVIPPEKDVSDFLEEDSQELDVDLCCKKNASKSCRTEADEKSAGSHISQSLPFTTFDEDAEQDTLEMLDDDFNRYCVASLQRKYTRIKESNMYSQSNEGQRAYHESKCAVNVLNILKEEEQYLQKSTNKPESLLNTERRQTISRRFTNVSDSVFSFFLKLTDYLQSSYVLVWCGTSNTERRDV
ncbi:hypothetical protein ScPMuIL_011488 [Solemya velum]